MEDIKVTFVSKDKIYPANGYMNSETRIMEIREDLNRFEICSLLVHEFGHLDDLEDKEGFIHKELESISMSVFYPIIGTVMIAFKSLTPDRLKWYWERFKKKE